MSISLLQKERRKSIDPLKVSQDNPAVVYLYRQKSRFAQRPEKSQISSILRTSQNSLPSLQSSMNHSLLQGKEHKYQDKLNNNSVINRDEALKGYRVRLRALLDTHFSDQIKKIQTKEHISSVNIMKPKPQEIDTKRKLELKTVEEKFFSKNFKVYRPAKDPYFFINILQRANFSSFYSILNIFTDTIGGFLYCNKFGTYASDTRTPANDRKVYIERKIFNDRKIVKTSEKSVCAIDICKVMRLKEIFPYLTRVFYTQQNVDCAKKVLVIELASVFLIKTFLPSVIHSLKVLSDHFYLAFIKDFQDLDIVLESAELQEIKLSAVYEIENYSKHCKLLDYSQIFLDFQCFDPSADCLVFTHHNIEDISEVKQGEIVGRQLGCSIRFNVEKIPLASYEFPHQPIIVTMASSLIDVYCSNLVKVVEVIMRYLRFNFSIRNVVNFKKILKDEFEFFESDLPHRSVVPYQVLIEYYRSLENNIDIKCRKAFKYNTFII